MPRLWRYKKKSAGRIYLPALFLELSPALLHCDRELDVAVLKGDLERVGVTRVQIGGGHVPLPVATGIGERTAGNIVGIHFVHAVNRAPHAAQHGYRTATSGRKDRIRVGDGVAGGVAHHELYWDGAASFALVNAATVGVDWR